MIRKPLPTLKWTVAVTDEGEVWVQIPMMLTRNPLGQLVEIEVPAPKTISAEYRTVRHDQVG